MALAWIRIPNINPVQRSTSTLYYDYVNCLRSMCVCHANACDRGAPASMTHHVCCAYIHEPLHCFLSIFLLVSIRDDKGADAEGGRDFANAMHNKMQPEQKMKHTQAINAFLQSQKDRRGTLINKPGQHVPRNKKFENTDK